MVFGLESSYVKRLQGDMLQCLPMYANKYLLIKNLMDVVNIGDKKYRIMTTENSGIKTGLN